LVQLPVSFQGIITVVCPASLIWIIPPQAHVSLQLLSSAGMFPISTVGAPGAHGAGIKGTQGIGVNAPIAAAVAAATVGFAIDEHVPNGMMFTIGMLSMMFAAGVPVCVKFVGNTDSVLGAAPKLHCNIAPIQTCIAIASPH
jgi:hypothetical protein